MNEHCRYHITGVGVADGWILQEYVPGDLTMLKIILFYFQRPLYSYPFRLFGRVLPFVSFSRS